MIKCTDNTLVVGKVYRIVGDGIYASGGIPISSGDKLIFVEYDGPRCVFYAIDGTRVAIVLWESDGRLELLEE